MAISPITIVFTLLGGLILAGILGWVRRARLIVLVPRQFTHSNLTSRGQLVEIIVFNRGFKTEEVVELMLNPTLQYEVVGSNSPDTSIDKAKLLIPRVGPSDEVTALLLVEGGSFSKADIANCTSKESKGDVVGRLEDVSPTGPQRTALVGLFVAVPLALYAMNLAFDYFFKSHFDVIREVAVQSVPSQKNGEEKATLEIHGWIVPKFYKTSSGDLFKSFSEGKVRVSVHDITRRKDRVSIPVVVENMTTTPFTYTLSIKAPSPQDQIPLAERMTREVFVMPNSRSEANVTALVPAKSQGDSSSVYVECFIDNIVGDSLSIVRTVSAK